MWLMALTGTPAFFASNEAARFWSRRVIANHLSAGIRGECERAIRQFVLHGLATVSTLTSGPAALLIALPCPEKIGLLARIKSARDCPSFLGKPPTKTTQSAPSKASSGLSVAIALVYSGNAQSSSSIKVPPSAGSAGVISRSCRVTGCWLPNAAPEARRKSKA